MNNTQAAYALYKKLMVEPLKANLDDLADAMASAEQIWRRHLTEYADMAHVANCPACRMAEALGMET